jgi:hypothetical protein
MFVDDVRGVKERNIGRVIGVASSRIRGANNWRVEAEVGCKWKATINQEGTERDRVGLGTFSPIETGIRGFKERQHSQDGQSTNQQACGLAIRSFTTCGLFPASLKPTHCEFV